ncbi:MAG: hypothetical protein ABH881_02845 [bacterium]
MYRKILKDAWQISWKSKYLWFFGLFAAFLGWKGEYEVIVRAASGNIRSQAPYWLQILSEKEVTVGKFSNLFVAETSTMIALVFTLLLILFLAGFLFWLAVVSQAAVINGSFLSLNKKGNNFEDNLGAGIKSFWPVLGMNLIMKITICACFALISLPLIFFGRSGNLFLADFVYFLIFIVFIPLAICFSFIVRYAINYSVLKKEKFVSAFAKGWKLFKDNWLVSVEVSLLIYLVSFLAGFAIVLFVATLIISLLFLLIIFKAVSLYIFWVIFSLGFFVILFFIICAGSLLSTFQISASTVLFSELISGGMKSKIVRIFERE